MGEKSVLKLVMKAEIMRLLLSLLSVKDGTTITIFSQVPPDRVFSKGNWI
jgi:hypothetical protein